MGGNVKALDEAISALKNNGLVLKVMERLQDYLSCKIKFLINKKAGLVKTAQTHKK